MTCPDATPRTRRLQRHGHAPLAAIVVITRGERDATLECLASIYELDYPCAIVAIVDDGSRDMTSAVVAETYPEVHRIRNAKPFGEAVATNQALHWAFAYGADYALLLDARVQTETNLLHRLIDAAQQFPNAGILGPTLHRVEKPEDVWFSALRFERPDEILNASADERLVSAPCPTPVDFVSRHAMLVTREIFETLGGFDDTTRAPYRDLEYCIRARRAGFGVLYVPHARLWYDDEESFCLEPRRVGRIARIRAWSSLISRQYQGRERLAAWIRGVSRLLRLRS